MRAKRECAQNLVQKTHHDTSRLSPPAHALHDTVESKLHMCFKYVRGSERALQTQRSAQMKTSYVCHQLHRGVRMRARQRRQIIPMYFIQATIARRACIWRAAPWKEATEQQMEATQPHILEEVLRPRAKIN